MDAPLVDGEAEYLSWFKLPYRAPHELQDVQQIIDNADTLVSQITGMDIIR